MKKWIIPVLLLGLLCVGCTETTDTTVGTVAEYEDTVAEIKGAEFYTTDDGKDVVKINVTYTNNGVNGMYLLESFIVKAFQNDTELTDCTDINDDGNLITEVKDGQSITGGYIFELTDTSTVEVRICTPTADEELLALEEYSND